MGAQANRHFSAGKIVYTLTDEAPALATRALLPIYEKFARVSGVEMERSDISLASRVLCQFPELLTEE
jgi:isocitrate dehydrogenase|tara:strand:- start:846 stop:1049 length:204 start_codon:yes stop_codon:yes gene_type:complete